MKYVILRDSLGFEYPIIFPDKLVHSSVAFAIKCVIDGQDDVRRLNTKEPVESATAVAAGFMEVIPGEMHGDSESLNLKSRPIDEMSLLMHSYGPLIDSLQTRHLALESYMQLIKIAKPTIEALIKKLGFA